MSKANSVKKRLAEFIRENPSATYSEWVDFQKTTPEVRIRQVTDSITQINLDGKSGFIDPSSWLNNFIAGQKIHMRESLETAVKVLSPEEILEVLKGLMDANPEKFSFLSSQQWLQLEDRLLYLYNEGDDSAVSVACSIANQICNLLYPESFEGEQGMEKLFAEST